VHFVRQAGNPATIAITFYSPAPEDDSAEEKFYFPLAVLGKFPWYVGSHGLQDGIFVLQARMDRPARLQTYLKTLKLSPNTKSGHGIVFRHAIECAEDCWEYYVDLAESQDHLKDFLAFVGLFFKEEINYRSIFYLELMFQADGSKNLAIISRIPFEEDGNGNLLITSLLKTGFGIVSKHTRSKMHENVCYAFAIKHSHLSLLSFASETSTVSLSQNEFRSIDELNTLIKKTVQRKVLEVRRDFHNPQIGFSIGLNYTFDRLSPISDFPRIVHEVFFNTDCKIFWTDFLCHLRLVNIDMKHSKILAFVKYVPEDSCQEVFKAFGAVLHRIIVGNDTLFLAKQKEIEVLFFDEIKHDPLATPKNVLNKARKKQTRETTPMKEFFKKSDPQLVEPVVVSHLDSAGKAEDDVKIEETVADGQVVEQQLSDGNEIDMSPFKEELFEDDDLTFDLPHSDHWLSKFDADSFGNLLKHVEEQKPLLEKLDSD